MGVRPRPPSCRSEVSGFRAMMPPLEGPHRQGQGTATRRTRTSATRREVKVKGAEAWLPEATTTTRRTMTSTRPSNLILTQEFGACSTGGTEGSTLPVVCPTLPSGVTRRRATVEVTVRTRRESWTTEPGELHYFTPST